MDQLGKRVCARFDALKSERSTYEQTWQAIADLFLPGHDNFTTTRVKGERQDPKLLDGTGVQCVDELANFMHGTLASPWTKWGTLATDADNWASRDTLVPAVVWADEAEDDDEVRDWLAHANGRMHRLFNHGKAAFGPQVHEMFLNVPSLGTGIFYCGESWESVVRFSARTLSECVVAEGEDGTVDTVIRSFRMTPRAAVQRFGDQVPEQIAKLAQTKPDEACVEILHAVWPREDVKGDGLDARSKRFASLYVFKDKGIVLRESGFDDFPYMVPRFAKKAGETYGYGPAWKALADVQMLQRAAWAMITGAEQAVLPPLQVPDDGYLDPIDLRAGAINYYRSDLARDSRIAPVMTGANPGLALDVIKWIVARVERMFYVDWLRLPELDRMTATEVVTRREQRLQLLSPLLVRQQSEFIAPLIDSVFGMMLRRGMFAPPPQSLQGRELKIEHVSPLSTAQQSIEADSIVRLFGAVAQFAPFDPTAAQQLDGAVAARQLGRLFNVPPGIVRSKADFEQRQASEKQRQQAAEAITGGAQIASAAKDAAQAQQLLGAVQ